MDRLPTTLRIVRGRAERLRIDHCSRSPAISVDAASGSHLDVLDERSAFVAGVLRCCCVAFPLVRVTRWRRRRKAVAADGSRRQLTEVAALLSACERASAVGSFASFSRTWWLDRQRVEDDAPAHDARAVRGSSDKRAFQDPQSVAEHDSLTGIVGGGLFQFDQANRHRNRAADGASRSASSRPPSCWHPPNRNRRARDRISTFRHC